MIDQNGGGGLLFRTAKREQVREFPEFKSPKRTRNTAAWGNVQKIPGKKGSRLKGNPPLYEVYECWAEGIRYGGGMSKKSRTT